MFSFYTKMDPSLRFASFRMTPLFQNKLIDLVMLTVFVILNEVKNPQTAKSGNDVQHNEP